MAKQQEPLTVAERLARIISGKENVNVLLSEVRAELANLKAEVTELQKMIQH
jgi:hypothetical protein